MIPEPTSTVGVIIGRFQVPELHPGHRELLDWVSQRCSTLVVLLGCAPVSSRSNPLSYVARRMMINSAYPEAIVMPLHDQRTDAGWSGCVDDMIRSVIRPSDTVMLYGSRDGFASSYTGKFPVQELEASDPRWSGTNERAKVSHKASESPEFRAGVIYAQNGEYPRVIPTVDVALFVPDNIVMVRKHGEDRFRFPGGYVEPGQTFEATVRREISEEVGDVSVHDPKYIGNTPIDDWRYPDQNAVIHTTFFAALRISGPIGKPSDTKEIAEVREFTESNLFLGYKDSIVPEHHVLVQMLQKHMEKE